MIYSEEDSGVSHMNSEHGSHRSRTHQDECFLACQHNYAIFPDSASNAHCEVGLYVVQSLHAAKLHQRVPLSREKETTLCLPAQRIRILDHLTVDIVNYRSPISMDTNESLRHGVARGEVMQKELESRSVFRNNEKAGRHSRKL